VFKNTCNKTASDFYIADLSQLKVCTPENNKNVFEYKGVRFDTTLRGGHQVYNALNAITALEVIGIEQKYIVSGVNRANAHARYETVFESPRVIVDAGHNKDGVEQLIETLKADDRIDGLTVIFGMLKDKAYQFAIREIASLATRMICVKPDSPRALSSFDMKNIAEMYCDECYGYDEA
jgi:dihydrofolate synthase/folylpolyglutamate synthase